MPLLFLLSPANVHDAPFARSLLELAIQLYRLRPPRRPPGRRLLGPQADCLDTYRLGRRGDRALESQTPEEPLVPAAHLDRRGTGETRLERFFGRVFSLFGVFHLQRPPLCGWSAVATQVALVYAATVVVGLAAQQAYRPDLIRSPKRVLAHLWEGISYE